MTVLILSTSENEHSLAVRKYLHSKGVRVVSINMDELNEFSTFFDVKSDIVSINGQKFLSGEISGVFSHHPMVIISKDLGTDDLDRQLCQASWINCIDWLEKIFSHSVWLNKPSVCKRTASVPYQLKIAHKIGFNTPNTCFTNNFEELMKFSSNYEKIILKTGPLGGLFIKGKRILAHLIEPKQINPTDLKSAPCLFQEYLEKSYELRVHVIRKSVFACKIESQENERTKVDWRDYKLSETPHSPVTLSKDIVEMCQKIVDSLGLNFGIIDLIVTPNQEIYFLECNSQGHWLWIEYLTGLPITMEVCDLLLSKP